MTAMTQMYAPEVEAPTLDSMERSVSMFAIMTGKQLTADEGFQFLTLWTMVNKSGAMVGAPAAAEIVEPAVGPDDSTTISPALPVSKAVSEPTRSAVVMPKIEEIKLPGIDTPLRKATNYIVSDNKYWKPGYLWRIDVVPFSDTSGMDPYYVHFSERPTQQQFNEHYAHYKAKRCSVHVRESDGSSSRRITDEYCSFTERGDVNYPSDETLSPRLTWRDGERFRIRFYDERIHQDNYIYYPNKPTKVDVSRLSTFKKVAIVECRRTGTNY